jgi:hypothetical protein
MATYKEINGGSVQNFSTNPDNPINGQVWYDETDNQLKIASVLATGAWATGGSLNTARESLAGVGTQTSALGAGGNSPETGLTESYNGTSWTEVADLNTARRALAGAGADNTSALVFGGFSPASPSGVGSWGVTESWNGTSWTEVSDLNQVRNDLAGVGINTAALAVGGLVGGVPAGNANTESWNGSSWTEVSDLNTGRRDLGGAGTNTAALVFGGQTVFSGPLTNNTESWNGSSWTEVNNLNTTRQDPAGAGTNTAALAFGGGTPSVTGVTETWNGTSWTEVADLSVARAQLAGAGTNTTGLAFGGALPSSTAATEEFDAPGTAIKTVTTI